MSASRVEERALFLSDDELAAYRAGRIGSFVSESPIDISPGDVIEEKSKKGVIAYRLNGNEFGCPFGQVGDRLYLKEKYWLDKKFDGIKQRDIPAGFSVYWEKTEDCGQSRAALYMPKSIARHVFTITYVEPVRFGNMTEDQAANCGLILAHKNMAGESIYQNVVTNQIFHDFNLGKMSLIRREGFYTSRIADILLWMVSIEYGGQITQDSRTGEARRDRY